MTIVSKNKEEAWAKWRKGEKRDTDARDEKKELNWIGDQEGLIDWTFLCVTMVDGRVNERL